MHCHNHGSILPVACNYWSRSGLLLDISDSSDACCSYSTSESSRQNCKKCNGNRAMVQVPYIFIILQRRIFRSTPPSRPNKAGPYVRPSVRPSIRPQKSYFDFNEIWYVGRGRRLRHDGMPYDPIQSHGQGHESLKIVNSTIFKGYPLPRL